AESVNEHGSVPGMNQISGPTYGLDRVEGVGAVAVDDGQISKTAEILRHDRVRGLLGDRNGYTVAVVLHNKDDRQSFAACSVECLKDIAFRAGRFALAGEYDRIGVVVLDRAAESCGVL